MLICFAKDCLDSLFQERPSQYEKELVSYDKSFMCQSFSSPRNYNIVAIIIWGFRFVFSSVANIPGDPRPWEHMHHKTRVARISFVLALESGPWSPIVQLRRL